MIYVHPILFNRNFIGSHNARASVEIQFIINCIQTVFNWFLLVNFLINMWVEPKVIFAWSQPAKWKFIGNVYWARARTTTISSSRYRLHLINEMLLFFLLISCRALMEVQWYLHQLQHKLQRLRLVQQYHEKRISHRLDCHTGKRILFIFWDFSQTIN